jgi:hypothetical protein
MHAMRVAVAIMAQSIGRQLGVRELTSFGDKILARLYSPSKFSSNLGAWHDSCTLSPRHSGRHHQGDL